MATLMRLSEAASIALHTMRLLAEESEDRLTTRDIAQMLGVSEAHLSKVLQRLTHGGFVSSTRGPKGGFSLVGDPAAITLKHVYEVIDGPLSDETCCLGHDICPRGECMFGGLMKAINEMARAHLEGTTLAGLADRWAARHVAGAGAGNGASGNGSSRFAKREG